MIGKKSSTRFTPDAMVTYRRKTINNNILFTPGSLIQQIRINQFSYVASAIVAESMHARNTHNHSWQRSVSKSSQNAAETQRPTKPSSINDINT